jgi:hypothetical protein
MVCPDIQDGDFFANYFVVAKYACSAPNPPRARAVAITKWFTPSPSAPIFILDLFFLCIGFLALIIAGRQYSSTTGALRRGPAKHAGKHFSLKPCLAASILLKTGRSLGWILSPRLIRAQNLKMSVALALGPAFTFMTPPPRFGWSPLPTSAGEDSAIIPRHCPTSSPAAPRHGATRRRWCRSGSTRLRSGRCTARPSTNWRPRGSGHNCWSRSWTRRCP